MTELSNDLESTALFRDRAEWKDVKPIYSSEDEEAVIRIAAAEECKILKYVILFIIML